jgi:hypothetical protein
VTAYRSTPVMQWLIVTDHPEGLLRELERAMADVRPGRGARIPGLARHYDLGPRTIPADPSYW